MGNTSILKKFETFNLDKAGKEINEILNTAVKEGDLKAVQDTITGKINASISELEKNLDDKVAKNDIDTMISELNASKLGIRTVIPEQDTILDLNDYTDNGIYIFNNNVYADNQPDPDINGGVIVVLQYPTGEDSNVVVQIAYWSDGESKLQQGDNPLQPIRQFTRLKTQNGKWTFWELVSVDGHKHTIDDISELDTVLDSKMPITKITTATDLNTLTETGVYLINVKLSTENHAPKNDSKGVLVVYKRSNAGFGANASIVQVFYRFDGEYTIMGAPQFPQFGMDTQPTSGVFVYTRVSYLRDDWGNWLEFSFKGHMHTIDNITDSFEYVRMKSDERTKLNGIAENANNYVHPDTHPLSIISNFKDKINDYTMDFKYVNSEVDLNNLTERKIYEITKTLSINNNAPRDGCQGVLLVYRKNLDGAAPIYRSFVQVFYVFNHKKPAKPLGGDQPISIEIYVRVYHGEGGWTEWRKIPFLDSNGKLPDEYLYGTTVKQYGVRWDGTSSTACERLGDAVGLVANAHHGTVDSVRNDFDDIYPWSDMRLCNIDDDGNILAYAGEPTFATDGSNGDVMVEIPKFYYKRVKEKDENGEYLPSEEIWICKLNLPGYELHPLFIDNGREVSKVFHSAYNPAKVNDNGGIILRSIAGVLPANNSPRKTYRNMAKARNTSSDKVIWGIEDLICISALQMLYLVEYADTNCQKTVGRGFSASTYDNMPANGSCNSLNGKSGYIGEDGKSDVSYRGIEGIWGKIYRLLDGANVKDYIVYYCNSIKDYDDVSFDGKYKANTYENASRKDKGHVSRLGYNQNAPWLLFPEDVGGSNATYIPDSYFGVSGEKVIMFGGNYDSGYASGLFYYGCNNGLDTYSRNNGTHLVVKTI